MWPFNKQGGTFNVHRPEISGGRQIDPGLRSVSALKRRTTQHVLTDQAPKRGMWVRYKERTGILTNIEPGDVATVMIVNQVDGTNVVEIHVMSNELRQAYFEEIPIGRRPDEAYAIKFGYCRKPS